MLIFKHFEAGLVCQIPLKTNLFLPRVSNTSKFQLPLVKHRNSEAKPKCSMQDFSNSQSVKAKPIRQLRKSTAIKNFTPGNGPTKGSHKPDDITIALQSSDNTKHKYLSFPGNFLIYFSTKLICRMRTQVLPSTRQPCLQLDHHTTHSFKFQGLNFFTISALVKPSVLVALDGPFWEIRFARFLLPSILR